MTVKITIDSVTYEVDKVFAQEIASLVEFKAVTKYENKAIIPAENKGVLQ